MFHKYQFWPPFSNIYINYQLLSLLDTVICNCADDTTIYACDKNLNNVIAKLVRILNSYKNLLMLGRKLNHSIMVKFVRGEATRCCNVETQISKVHKKAGGKLFALPSISG